MQSLSQRSCIVRGLDLSPLCGTTTISMILIIIGHRWGFRLPGPLQNYEANEEVRFVILIDRQLISCTIIILYNINILLQIYNILN